MSIDQCTYTFKDLERRVLPTHMKALRKHMTNPEKVATFARPGVGLKSLLKEFGKAADFPGCYVLLEAKHPIYVGISRSVFSRLKQHATGTTHFDASLAYRIAAARAPHKQTRSQAMSNASFNAAFHAAQTYIHGLNVAFTEIFNPLELHIFEAYCAMELDTHEWNTFETH